MKIKLRRHEKLYNITFASGKKVKTNDIVQPDLFDTTGTLNTAQAPSAEKSACLVNKCDWPTLKSSLCLVTLQKIARSTEGDELGASGGTVTNLTVLDGLVGHGVFGEVLTAHVSLDLDGSPVLSRVDLSDTTDHLGHDDSVTEVGLDGLGLLTVGGVLDGGPDLLDESVVLGVDTVLESATLSGLEKGDDVLGVHLEELVDFDTSVSLFLEWFSLGDLSGGCFRHLQLTIK